MKLNIVPARTGITWVKLGFKTFWQQPLAMSGLFFMFMALLSVATLVPFIGAALALALLPAALRAGALRFWISRLWDFHLPREAAVLAAHDPGHFERVLRERLTHPFSLTT